MGELVPLKGSPYDTRDPIRAARRCVNLYPEQNGGSEVFPYRYWPTPGLRLLAQAPNKAPIRCQYTASNGDLYAVAGSQVYYISQDWSWTALGTIPERNTPASMADNGLCIALVDGTADGYVIDMQTRAFGGISSTQFSGADRVDYVDTYFVFNNPGTNKWYISVSEATFSMMTGAQLAYPTALVSGQANVTLIGEPLDTSNIQVNAPVTGTGVPYGATVSAITNNVLTLSSPAFATDATGSITIPASPAFDSLDTAAKTGGPDQLQTIIVKHREVWLIGSLTSEPWYDAGSADFAFAAIPGAFIDHGCVARYSVARQDVSVFWLSRDREGQGIVVKTDGYEPKRISTHGIEADIQTYSRIDDAIGFCLQQNGHAFYILTFPSADKTWAFDLSANNAADAWSEWAWMDDNGNLHRHRANAHTFAYGLNLVGDWQNGNLYALDPTIFTDNGKPVRRIRTFPHLQGGGNLITYKRFIADVQVGSDTSGGSLGSPQISLRYSGDRGANWSDPLINTLGAAGEYATQVDWYQLGCGRDYVFELSYSAPVQAALSGGYIEAEAHAY